MLTSNPSNQYLRPDYLTPLSTTLDAKNSPLALLAQTCSAIGADSPNPKLLANIEKSTKSNCSNNNNNNKLSSSSSTDGRDKLSPHSNQSSLSTSSLEHVKSSFKPYEPQVSVRERTNLTPTDEHRSSSNLGNHNQSNSSGRIKTPKSHLNGISNSQRCDSNQSATSQNRDSPTIIVSGNSNSRKTPIHQMNGESLSPQHHQRASSKESHESPRLPNDLSKEHNSLAPKSSNSSTIQTNNSYFSGYSSALGSGYPMDLMTASALMSPHHPMLKAAALSPYFNYARLKGADPAAAAAAAAAGMLPPMCRDPYCTGCPINPHIMNKATGQPCPAGCLQCDPSASKSYQSGMSAAAYAHAQLAALAAASQLPYVCSWIAGDSAYCGKRFGTSDELFQHLRTHTANMSESMLNAVAATGLPPNHPLFQRTYPTPPISPLSASARYHPYGKPSVLPPSLGGPPPPGLAGLPMPPHPSLAQYFSPYSLYGSRMGTSPSMHP